MDDAVAKVLERIRMFRQEKGLSILELANRAELSHSYVYYLESKQKIPSLTTLYKLAVAMDINMRDFFGS